MAKIPSVHTLAYLQRDYKVLTKRATYTKEDLDKVITPFMEEFGVSRMKAMEIARGALSVEQIASLFEEA